MRELWNTFAFLFIPQTVAIGCYRGVTAAVDWMWGTIVDILVVADPHSQGKKCDECQDQESEDNDPEESPPGIIEVGFEFGGRETSVSGITGRVLTGEGD